MELSASAHLDTFCRDNLPPQADWPEMLFELETLDYPERLNCARALLDDQVAAGRGDRRCVAAADGAWWTYAELQDRADRLARLLVDEEGIVPGNRVLLRGPNSPWLVAIWFGVVKAGGVVVPTMPMLRQRELEAIIDVAQISMAVCDARFLADLELARPEGLPVLCYGDQGSDSDLTRRVERIAPGFEAVDTAADDVAMLAFTSGTTGRPKATMHFHRDVLANADTFSHFVLRPTEDDVFIGTPPIAFTFGLGGLVVFPMRVGAASVMVERATPDELARLVAAHEATIVLTAPTAYKVMLAKGHAGALRSLRRAVSAGEHLPRTTFEEMEAATGLRLIDGIGSTEMLHIFISAADDDIRPGSTGKPVPGYRATILDLDGNEVPDGEPGRLAVKGPTGCRYLADPRQSVYVHNGWNITGDTFIRDTEGYFWYQARSDDIIVSSGYNISGTEVEEALGLHSAVLESAVVAVPDEDRGSVAKAFVVLREGHAATDDLARELQDHVKAEIAPYKYPRRVEFIEALPRTSTGKVQRYVLRASP